MENGQGNPTPTGQSGQGGQGGQPDSTERGFQSMEGERQGRPGGEGGRQISGEQRSFSQNDGSEPDGGRRGAAAQDGIAGTNDRNTQSQANMGAQQDRTGTTAGQESVDDQDENQEISGPTNTGQDNLTR